MEIIHVVDHEAPETKDVDGVFQDDGVDDTFEYTIDSPPSSWCWR